MDIFLLSRLSDTVEQKWPWNGPHVSNSGLEVDLNLISKDFFRDRAPSPGEPNSNEDPAAVARIFDMPFIQEIDLRVRWCRHVMHSFGLPCTSGRFLFHEDGDRLHWEKAKDNDARALSACHHAANNAKPYSPLWFAAVCLSHIERGLHLLRNNEIPYAELGVIREFVLFGEVFNKAANLLNNGKKL